MYSSAADELEMDGLDGEPHRVNALSAYPASFTSKSLSGANESQFRRRDIIIAKLTKVAP